MRRVVLTVLLALFMVVPAMSAGADSHCVDFTGSAKLDWGGTLQGKAKLDIDGVKTKVDFVQTGFTSTGLNTADVFFDWHFPSGTVSIVEHSTVTPLFGPLVLFNSTIDVLTGATGTWTWSGVSNNAAGKAHIQTITGELCFGVPEA